MKDIALSWNDAALRADWQVDRGAVVEDGGLRTAVMISLFTDGQARADDAVPDGSDDRRGWWGDLPRDGQAPDPIGSRLWLLAREKRTEATRLRAEAYAREALAWLVRDGVASAVDVTAAWGGAAMDQLRLSVRVSRRGGAAPASEVFDMAWNVEAAR